MATYTSCIKYSKEALLTKRGHNFKLNTETCQLINSLALNAKVKTRRGKRGGNKSKLSLCYFNAQSIRNKTDVINEYIIEKDLDFCTITETWLKENDDLIAKFITPDGYKLEHVDRKGKCGGGIAVLYQNCFHLNLDHVLSFSSLEYMSLV